MNPARKHGKSCQMQLVDHVRQELKIIRLRNMWVTGNLYKSNLGSKKLIGVFKREWEESA